MQVYQKVFAVFLLSFILITILSSLVLASDQDGLLKQLQSGGRM